MDHETIAQPLEAIVEGLLFAAGEEGLSLLQLQSVLQDKSREDIQKALISLKVECSSALRGIELVSYGQRWKFVAKESIYPYAVSLYGKNTTRTLSNAAMEVLALIAYRQPITRVEIDDIRGVSSDMMLKKLLTRGLIETCGHLDAIGRPLLYRVSQEFMDQFGLDSLNDLPECELTPLQEDLFASQKEDD